MGAAMFAILVKLLRFLGSFPAEAWNTLRNRSFTTYHPEQHYMRGPGPKCRERQPGAPVA